MDDKKRAITLSAMEVFQEKGIEKATVSDIVKGAGIAQGTFYLYFKSKLSVMPSIAEEMIEMSITRFHEKIDKEANFSVQLKQLLDMVFDYTKEYRDIYALIYVGMGSNEQFHEWESVYEPYYRLISELLKTAQEKEEINPSLHPERTGTLLLGILETAAEQLFLYDISDEPTVKIKKKETFSFIMAALQNNTNHS